MEKFVTVRLRELSGQVLETAFQIRAYNAKEDRENKEGKSSRYIIMCNEFCT